MHLRSRLARLLADDPYRRQVLETTRLATPGAWLTGGFVRNRIWDDLAGTGKTTDLDDVDVIVFEPAADAREGEANITTSLRRIDPATPWSVRNQARMHLRSGDSPYDDLEQALRAFPDTASAIAVRLEADGSLAILAPYGLSDAFEGIVRPTPVAQVKGDGRYAGRLARKAAEWQRQWPFLEIETRDATPDNDVRR